MSGDCPRQHDATRDLCGRGRREGGVTHGMSCQVDPVPSHGAVREPSESRRVCYRITQVVNRAPRCPAPP